MGERTSGAWGCLWVIAVLLGAFVGLSLAVNITDHFEIRDLQRRIAVLEQSK
jgi:hypothetical protein